MGSNTRRFMVGGTFAVFALLAALLPGTSLATDHRDAPLNAPSSMDVLDIYVFASPNDPGDTVIILTTNPDSQRASFPLHGFFEIAIDNDQDYVADLSFTSFFGVPGADGAQDVTVFRVDDSGANEIVTGSTNTVLSTPSSMHYFAGRADDPFFFDIPGFRGAFGEVDNGRTLLDGDQEDAFAGENVNAIAFEIDHGMLIGGTGSGISLWATSWYFDGGELMQADRVGQPMVNLYFNSPGTVIGADPTAQGIFNLGDPLTDDAWLGNVASGFLRGSALDTEGAFSAAFADDLADIILPDVLMYDPNLPPGHPNGRLLTDDVVDTQLNIWSGGTGAGRDGVGAFPGDGIDGNDQAFEDVFPYLAPPHPIVEEDFPPLFGVVDTNTATWMLTEPITAKLTGDDAVPGPGDPTGSGFAVFTMNQMNDKLCFDVDLEAMSSGITAMHLHEGAVGVAGPVVQDLDFPSNGTAGCVTAAIGILDELLDLLDSGDLYVNVHTEDAPAGAIRGQLHGGPIPSFAFGIPGDSPGLGDFDGDGFATPFLHRSNGQWFGSNELPRDGSVPDVHWSTWFGIFGDLALMGDYDGDGDDTPLLVRQSTGQWYKTDALGTLELIPLADDAFFFGGPFDDPYVADINGDGIDDIGVMRGSTFFWRLDPSTGFADGSLSPFGDFGDQPLWQDWNADGITTPAIYREGAGGAIFIDNMLDGGFADMEMWFTGWGTGDVAVVGDNRYPGY